jgi:hypothetical protein
MDSRCDLMTMPRPARVSTVRMIPDSDRPRRSRGHHDHGVTLPGVGEHLGEPGTVVAGPTHGVGEGAGDPGGGERVVLLVEALGLGDHLCHDPWCPASRRRTQHPGHGCGTYLRDSATWGDGAPEVSLTGCPDLNNPGHQLGCLRRASAGGNTTCLGGCWCQFEGMLGTKEKPTYHFLHPDDDVIRLLKQHHGLPPLPVDDGSNREA